MHNPIGRAAEQAKRKVFYWKAVPQQAVRVGDWKLYGRAPDRPAELSGLAADIGESRNVADKHPDTAARLTRLLTDSRVDSPNFPL